MAFINVAEWTPENVAQWLQGLEDCILPYVHFFLNNQINGCRLLLLSSEDLTKLNVTKIGHQEIILDGVDLLKHLHYNFNSETLQSLALRLGCKSRSLYNQLKQEQEELQINLNNLNQGSQAQSSAQNAINKNGTIKESKNKSHKNSTKKQDTNLNSQLTTHKSNKVSTKTLFAVCDILNAAKTFISWIDRYPFEGQEIYIPIRKTILKLSIELASTAQRDQFVDKPNNIILTNCLTFAGLCDRIVQDLHDSLAIQPASLDVALIKKRSNEELGMHIHSSYSGIHIISGIKLSSATNNCGRIDEGDEIVQVNYRTVVGWQLRKLVDIMKEYQTELILTLKKRPKHNIASGQVSLIKPFKLPLKEYSMNQRELPIIMNGSMTLRAPKPKKPLPTELYSNLDDTLINREITYNHLDTQMLNGSLSKGKAAIRRRATISGSSSSVNQCGAVRVDDLLIKNHQNSAKILSENKQDTIIIPHVAKVQPIQQNEETSPSSSSKQTTTTVPKQLTTFSVNNSNGKSVATIKSTTTNSENVGIVLPNTSRSNEQQQLKLSTFQSDVNSSQNDLQKSINTTAPSLPNKPPPKPRNSTNSSNNNSLNLSNKPPLPQAEKPAIPVRPPSLISKSANLNQQIQSIKLNRFVTLKQIEDENSMFFKQNPTSQLCQLINNCNSSTNNNTIDKPSAECNNLLSGWLYLKREHFNTLLNAKWAAKYIQLSTNYQLYAFKNEHAIKSDLVINLAAFKVSPACECKSKDNVFKVFNKHVIFLFACETQQQMRQWVDTLRQLVSNCASTKPELMRLSTNPDIACYSETEDEEDVIDDEMMLQNFANELVETNKQQETIESKIDLIKTETISNDEKQLIKTEEDIKQIKLEELKSTPIKIAKNEEKMDENNYENTDDDKHCRRMNRLLERRSRQRYTSTAESCRDSSPSSTSSGSSSANTSSAGQAVLSRFAAISELKERLQKQAQEKLEQRRLAIASGKKMFERSASCMDASMITNLNNKLALANQANTTNNTPIKGGSLLRNKSGSQQSLLSPISNDVFNLSSVSNVSNNSKTEPLTPKPAYMSKQAVLPPIPPRPPKPSSISITNTTNTITNSTANNTNKITDNSQQILNNIDELNKRSQPLPQPRTSKNGLPINIEENKNSCDNHNLNKENINSNKQNESILKKTLDQNSSLPNHKNPEYISNMIDECFSFVDEIKTEQVISKPILQNNQINQQSNQKSELLTTAPQSLKKLDFNQQPINEPNSMLNYQPNFNNNVNNNQMINNQLNQMNMMNNQINQMNMMNNQLSEEQLYSMLMNGKLVKEEDDLDDDELEFDDEECLEDDEEYSDEEDEFDLMNNQNKNNQDYNRMFNNTQILNNNNNNFNQTGNDNLFGYNSSSNQINSTHNSMQNNSDNDFCAPGPNFLNSAPGLTLNQPHQNNNNSLLNYQSDHLRNDLGSSSNSNNYPTSSSTNSYNISPYSSISQHNNNNQQNDHHSPTQLETAFKEHINQLSSQFTQSCNTNSMDGQASDSGVGSYVSALAQIKTQEYTNSLVQLNIEPEIRQRMIEEFQRSFQIHFATQVKTQEYMNSLPQDLDLEIKQRMIEEFQKNCHAHFTAQLQMQQKALEILGLQQNQQQQQQQQNNQLFNLQNSQQQNNIQNQMANGLMGDNHHLQQLINQQQAFNSDMLNDLDEDLDDEDLTDSEFDYDEESDFDDFEEADQIEAAKSNQEQGRRKSKFKLFGTSPKLLKKLTTLKQQKEKRSRTGNNNNSTTNSQGDTIDASIKSTTDDASSVWISMGDKILNDDNELESIKDGSNIKEEEKEMENKKEINREDKSNDKSLLEKEQNNKSDNTSLNSSHSSFVQLKTSERQAKETTTSKPTSPKLASSLASKWFGRNKSTEQSDTKTTNDSKKKNAPQITQVIYKRKPDLPKLPEKQNNSKENDNKSNHQMISVPSDDSEETDDDPIYHEINETQLVLEEMRRSLMNDNHKTERQIIEMILQDNKLNRSTDQLKVK